MATSSDLRGQRFFRLTAVEKCLLSGKWICDCECGNTIKTTSGNLRSGHTKSCGCLKREKATSHGHSQAPEYWAWASMIQRCINPNNDAYRDYGGRGISVCSRWKDSFSAFLSDMGRRPSRLHSIDRIDNNKGYSPDNCRWATLREQSRNRRNTHWIEIDGERRVVSDWAAQKGLHYTTILHRLERGLSERDAVMTPPVFSGRRATQKTA